MKEKRLDEKLIDEAYAFEFFQAVRLIEKCAGGRSTVGADALPADEPLRFRSRVGFEFPGSEIHEIRKVEHDGDSDAGLEMIVNFMGLTGPSGVLPTHYSELLYDRVRHGDTALWAFLDIFTHRAVSMFYQAWAKYKLPVRYERGNDDFTSYMFDLIGLGTKGLRGRMDVDDESMLHYAGLVAQKPHSAGALKNIVSDYFGFGAEVEQFFGQWLELDPHDRSYLGAASLGVSTVAGTRIWSQQTKFRLSLGPLSFSQFQTMLPGGDGNKKLASIVRFMIGTELDFDVKLLLEAGQVPSTILTTHAVRRPMLGWTSYLKTTRPAADDEQVVLQFGGDLGLN